MQTGRTEKIGNVVLDYSHYPEQDFYCDGASEDALLELVKTIPPREYPQEIYKAASWEVLYHLSDFSLDLPAGFRIVEDAAVVDAADTRHGNLLLRPEEMPPAHVLREVLFGKGESQFTCGAFEQRAAFGNTKRSKPKNLMENCFYSMRVFRLASGIKSNSAVSVSLEKKRQLARRRLF